MTQPDTQYLRRLASKYIWWQSPDESIATPARIVAQVMNLGDYDDVQMLAAQIGEDVLRDVLQRAEAGQFSARSWTYWHYRLGLAEVDKVPPVPTRKFS